MCYGDCHVSNGSVIEIREVVVWRPMILETLVLVADKQTGDKII